MGFLDNLFGNNTKPDTKPTINWQILENLNQLDALDKQSFIEPIIIFKHSTRCSVSRMALKEFENEFVLQDKMTPYFLDLLNYRNISDKIAVHYNIDHQSPQILVIKNGKAVYSASHSAIDATILERWCAI